MKKRISLLMAAMLVIAAIMSVSVTAFAYDNVDGSEWFTGATLEADGSVKINISTGFTGANGRKLGKSTGMGLYIVRKLCDKMSIAAEAASMPGESTTITLCFPLGDEYNLTKM